MLLLELRRLLLQRRQLRLGLVLFLRVLLGRLLLYPRLLLLWWWLLGRVLSFLFNFLSRLPRGFLRRRRLRLRLLVLLCLLLVRWKLPRILCRLILRDMGRNLLSVLPRKELVLRTLGFPLWLLRLPLRRLLRSLLPSLTIKPFDVFPSSLGTFGNSFVSNPFALHPYYVNFAIGTKTSVLGLPPSPHPLCLLGIRVCCLTDRILALGIDDAGLTFIGFIILPEKKWPPPVILGASFPRVGP